MKPSNKILKIVGMLTVMAIGTVSHHAQAQQAGYGPNFETRLSSIEDQMRAMNGQVEQLGFSIRRLDQSVQRMQGDYDTRLAKLETTTATLQATVESLQNAKDANGNLGTLKGTATAPATPLTAPSTLPVADTNTDTQTSPQEQYDHAFSMLRQANYDEAEKAFHAFIEKNPKDKLIDNAKYWYGETLYVRGKYPDAVLAFADAFQQNPQGTKAPDSLLKLAMSFAASDKKPEACTTLSELKSKYPNASSTIRTRAAEQSSKIKCNAN